GVTVAGALSFDTTVKWKPVAGAAAYRIHWRRNDAQDWQKSPDIPASATSTVLKDIRVDDHFVGVGAVAANGAESLVTFA
ncbi:fibronectin type III domain-containing protein, partial [Acinetobacter baumannii]